MISASPSWQEMLTQMHILFDCLVIRLAVMVLMHRDPGDDA